MWGGRAAIALGALAFTLGVSWPLVRCFGRCLGDVPDTLLSVYFLRWVAHALTTPGVRLLDASFFAPYSGTLGLGEYMPAYAPLAVPTLLATGNPVIAHNVVLVAAYTLAGLGATALAARVLGATAPALLAGVVFGFSPRLLQQAHNLQALSAFWVPWLFLVLERFLARPTWVGAGALTGLGLGLALSSMVAFAYAAVAVAVFLLAAGWWGARPIGSAHAIRLGAAGAAGAALLAVYLAPYRALAREWQLGRTLGEVELYSASLGDYLGVPPEHLLHRLVGVGRVVDLDREALFPGITVAALVVLGLREALARRDGQRSRLLPYVVMAGAAALLAFGPTWASPWGPVPLPYRLLYEAVPGFAVLRTPRRFAALLALGLAVVAAAGAAHLMRRWAAIRPALVLTGLVVLVLVEAVTVPFPGTIVRLDAADVPEVYRWLATEGPETVALGIPMGDLANLAAAAYHLRRTVNGWSSYLPPHYVALAEAIEAFPGPRAVALIHGVRPDVVLIDRRWLNEARRAALARPETGFRLERAFPTHLVYRLGGEPPAGVETLEVTARLEEGGPERGRQACVTLRNPGPRFVPLYPLRQLHLQVGDGTADARWLPLDLAPGADHTTCVGAGAGPVSPRIRGEIVGAGRVHRFVATPDGIPRPLAPGG